jgi:hypothetical protein
MLAVDVEQLARLVEKPILIGQQGTQFGRGKRGIIARDISIFRCRLHG